MIISVHLPKTAGSSFAASLEEHFGPSLLKDYADLPTNTPPEVRNRTALENGIKNAEFNFAGIECIHGHFLPVKYLPASVKNGMKFVAWMRNPVDRVLSHFHFWKKFPNTPALGELHGKMIAENWSLERFCLGPEVRNLYCQFLWAFPLRSFDFVGITEFYEEDLNYFGRFFLGKKLEAKALNTSGGHGKPYAIDGALRKQIEAYHSMDMDLYRMAVEKRAARRCIKRARWAPFRFPPHFLGPRVSRH
jgi:hypothetical protein